MRHVDRRHRCSLLCHRNDSTVADNVGFALAPDNGLGKRSNWLGPGHWPFPPAHSRKQQPNSSSSGQHQDYIELVAENEGWANVPPGARKSLYETPEYQGRSVRQMTLDSILSADPNNSTVEPSPYVGIQFAAIPEFAGIATEVSQEFSAAYAGQQSVEERWRRPRPSPTKQWKPPVTAKLPA
jgi:sorbitol/mannitol transport system substrate-binding protein